MPGTIRPDTIREENLKELSFAGLLAKYPQSGDSEGRAALCAGLATNRRKIIVLDDDPTGVQTVHGVSVYTDWKAESIAAGFDEEASLFFILTNSRGMTAEESARAHTEIGKNIAAVSREKKRDFILISRSDSTLRGHYPLETLVLKNTLESETGLRYDGEIICPFFMEGGRYTAENIHYVKTGDTLVPAAQTEFAKDSTFGYSHSELDAWIEEKTGLARESVKAVSLRELRAGDIGKITRLLAETRDFGKIIVNALDYTDIKVFAAAFFRALEAGQRFILRTAAALPKVLGGIPDKPLLEREDLLPPAPQAATSPASGGGNGTAPGGLIIAGSHTRKTSRQLELLLERKDIVPIEFNVHLVADEGKFREEIRRVQKLCDTAVESGQTTVIFTSRERLELNTGNKEDDLRIAVRIAGAVTSFAANLKVKPRFIIAKGGITSSEIGTTALKVKKALVLGQVLPGIPVWLTGGESRFPNMPYIIFPGNVGEEDSLLKIVNMLC